MLSSNQNIRKSTKRGKKTDLIQTVSKIALTIHVGPGETGRKFTALEVRVGQGTLHVVVDGVFTDLQKEK
jgi:hypothetical protein